ncbi:MAG: c-type cytochrome [Gemmatimonadota bacterium]|jgi:hypothetical protein
MVNVTTSATGRGSSARRACPSSPRILTLAVLAGGLMAMSAPAAAQIPDTFENLQVLPEDISREELTGIMRGFALALGVRCQYCHPGNGGQGLQGIDFKSDEDPDKGKARFMMRMVAMLNDSTLPKLPDRDRPSLNVQCVTCHHGLSRPITLAAELTQTLDRFGTEAAVARYHELREQYYGSGAYDFGAISLNELGRALAQSGRSAEAITMLELNAEQYPEDVTAAVSLGQLYARAGDREKAIASFERALRIQPDNRLARQALQRLRGG